MDTLLVVAVVVLWLVVLGQAFLLLGALRAVGLLTWRLDAMEAIHPRRPDREGLPPGTRAPDFVLPAADGGQVALRVFTGRPVLLVFTQTGCSPCHAIMPELTRVHRQGSVQVIVVNNGSPEATRRWADEAKAAFPVLCQEAFQVSKQFRVYATPFAFLIDEAGVITAKGIAGSRQYLGYVLHRTALSDADRHDRAARGPDWSGLNPELSPNH